MHECMGGVNRKHNKLIFSTFFFQRLKATIFRFLGMQTDDVREFLDWCRTQKIEFDGLELIHVQVFFKRIIFSFPFFCKLYLYV